MSLKKLAKYIMSLLPIRFRCIIQSFRLSGNIKIGRGSYIESTVHCLGKNNIQIGNNTCLSSGCWLNVNHYSLIPSIIIGDNCFIGKNNFFTSGKIIRIGDYTLTTIDCKFIGSSHNIDNPGIPYLMTGTTNNDELMIGVNCFIGAGTTVLGHVKVGHGSVIGANSFVTNDVPPFSIVVGNPAKVIKRYSFVSKAWVTVSSFALDDETLMPDEDTYLAQLKAQFPVISMPWIAAGKSMGDL